MTRHMQPSKLIGGLIVLTLLTLAGAKIAAVLNTPAVTFSIELGGSAISRATAYQLEPVERNNKVAYSLKITRHLTNDTSWMNAFQAGMVFTPAIVRVYDSSLVQLNTYTLGNATVSSVRHTGMASDPFVTEEIALLSPSLVVTTP